ncbi:MAG: sulfite exporter TauE/SafE family protein [Actinobacteria bacterium]|nr:sulfite exporter TauE/SafE family protein [Actinomycetota bacterium]
MQIILLIVIGLGGGILSGMFGIGGGIVIVPALVYLLKFSQHKAQGTSLVALLLPIGILGVIEYYKSGNVDFKAAAFIVLGFVGGVLLGAHFIQPISDLLLKRLFGVLLLALSIYMIIGK